jgi:hypothetical protein
LAQIAVAVARHGDIFKAQWPGALWRGCQRRTVLSSWSAPHFCVQRVESILSFCALQQLPEIIAYFEQVSRGIKFIGTACRCFKLHPLFLD